YDDAFDPHMDEEDSISFHPGNPYNGIG
ncbi:hypothetical protein A2U01_0109559, partial [Trifolium medium]|nr:hypothetical protein [Trifolium medium]